MKLKDGLILRNVAGQFVIIPTGNRVREITNTVYISASGAYLWDYMKNDFTKEELVNLILQHYIGVTREVADKDISSFLETLKNNNVLEPESSEPSLKGGSVRIMIQNDAEF